MLDVDALAAMLAPIIAGEVSKEIAPLQAEIAALKAAPAPETVDVARLVQDEVAKLPAPENGKDADPEQVASLVAEAVERAVAALPAPQDGKSVGVEDVAPLIVDEVAKIAPDMAALNETIAAEVAKAVAAVPVPKDGKDAANIVEALKDSGELVLTLQDGRLIRTGIRDGKDGEPGQDGFSLDDFDMEPGEDGRTYTLKFARGETVHKFELTFPCPVYCGVWKEAESYVPGDLVTWGGSAWHCNKADPGKPDTKDSGWQLMVKKGRDGKDRTKD